MKKVIIILLTLVLIFTFSIVSFANTFYPVNSNVNNTTLTMLFNFWKNNVNYNPFDYYIAFRDDTAYGNNWYLLLYSDDPTFSEYYQIEYNQTNYQQNQVIDCGVYYGQDLILSKYDNSKHYVVSNLDDYQLSQITEDEEFVYIPLKYSDIETDKFQIVVSYCCIAILVFSIFKLFRIRIGDKSI